MLRALHVVPSLLVFVLSLGLCATSRAQDPAMEAFVAEFLKAQELADDKLLDKAMKKSSRQAIRYFEDLCWQRRKGDAKATASTDAMIASWKRTFENSETLDRLLRWCEGVSTEDYEQLRKAKEGAARQWRFYEEQVSKGLDKAEYQKLFTQFCDLARNIETVGHNLEAAEMWGTASVIGTKMPEKSPDDRRTVLDAIQQFLEMRKGWGYTFDEHYIRNNEFLKAERDRIEEAVKLGDKRKAEGYDPNSKGLDALLMPNAVEEKHALKYEPLTAWDTDLDYGPRNGAVPAFWWMASTEKEGTHRPMSWFRRVNLSMMRLGAAKFGVTLDPTDPKKAFEIEASTKAKPSTFWLDAGKRVPYTMFFWTGSDREMVGEAECNMMPSTDVGNVYYRSAASWKTTIGQETLVLYDDNASGNPCDANPFELEFRVHSLGDHDGQGTVVPLFDSMRIGKGPRQPYSEFLHLPTGWFHLKKGNEEIGLRAFNPEYLKTGKVKLVWAGPKPSAPVQLVVQGEGDYRTAIFDVAGGKEVEVPAGNYTVIFGRVLVGKGSRAQQAVLYQGNSKSFTVEAGKTFELRMGAPFTLQFARRGDQMAKIDALKIFVQESSGCVFTELHGLSLAPEVLAAKAEDGKGAKVVGKFVRFTDPELVNKAASKHNNLGLLVACFPMPEGYRDNELVLAVTMPAEGMKMALSVKKHALFGAMTSAWQ